MKFGIDMGHNCPPDTGATGIKQEDALTKAVGTQLIQKLRAANHTAIDCTPTSASSVTDSLRQRTNKANANNVNVYVSIHFNKFNAKAHGTEIYAISNASQGIAESVLKEIVQLGFYNRGVKDTGFFVLKNTQMPAILIECCFCDAKVDMDLFDVEKMAEAIKDGLIGQPKPKEPKADKKYVLEITTKTFLKPSTEQASDLPKDSIFEIEPGDYPILDVIFEENHYSVKWPDQSKGNRNEHFVYAGHAKVIEKD
ncbi:N-acetylmuramoyl-L-alanine amidase [Nostoc sp. C057]|uniref:N-acetylmuramoyl-L-alanine amidase n=1 Tax=Nostoc sp. C057 TaxID=2576903 RepID=UPI0015C37FFC|nr:N-acetylmuramoyl-L-alanine amidase [Nostoc sp. C057]QLE48271.1 N-acetylmuramoyl-L-alanine amidase [Nostoc sp. C057]